MELGFKGLKVYQLAFKAAMEIFEISKSFPKEELYSLTDQIRRSSRSVCSCIGEGYSILQLLTATAYYYCCCLLPLLTS